MNTQPANDQLHRALQGDYDFSITDVIASAWKKVKGVKQYYWGAIILYIIIAMIINVFTDVSFDAISYFVLPTQALTATGTPVELSTGFVAIQVFRLIIDSLLAIVIYLPLAAGIVLISLRWVKLKKACVYYIFRFFKKDYIYAFFWFWIASAAIFFVTSTLAGVSFGMASTTEGAMYHLFFVLLGIILSLAFLYFVVGFILTFPLIVDRKMNGWKALMTSLKVVNHHWFKMFGLMLVIFFVTIISAIPLLIGLIWTVPWGYNTIAEVYQTILGIVGNDPVTQKQRLEQPQQ